ncbi:MAG: GntR family transcriptional regulator [Hyphomicrobiales bacterium]|nr:GntR family transcriptional regulator [Hyphomicrobiales bacterium]
MSKRMPSARPPKGPRQRLVGSEPAKSLLDRAYSAIKLRIITCRYRPGKVLSEAAISQEMKIGRTPVHQAVLRLVMDGLVSIMPRKGIVVQPVSIDEAIDIITVRLLTECYCARLAADHADQTDIQDLEEILTAHALAVEERDMEQMMLLDRQFHDVLARAARNTVLAGVLRNLHERSLRFWFISLQNQKQHRRVLDQHRAIVAALRRRQPEAAEAAMRRHIVAFQDNVTRRV